MLYQLGFLHRKPEARTIDTGDDSPDSRGNAAIHTYKKLAKLKPAALERIAGNRCMVMQ